MAFRGVAAIAHHIEQGMSPRVGTIKAISEVTGPVIGITMVSMAVFLPSVFLGGITGQLYRQFALTIAASAVISAINAVTLKPAQSARYLRKKTGPPNAFARAFNWAYSRVESAYAWSVVRLAGYPAVTLVVFGGLLALTIWWYRALPTGFLPSEDQGYIIVNVQLPDAASQARTRGVVAQLDAILKDTPGVDNWFVLGGFSLLDGTAQPTGAEPVDAGRTSGSASDGKISRHLSVAFPQPYSDNHLPALPTCRMPVTRDSRRRPDEPGSIIRTVPFCRGSDRVRVRRGDPRGGPLYAGSNRVL